MTSPKEYPLIKLPINYIKELRDCMNRHKYLMLNNEPFSRSWNILCACADRIEDTAKYLNSKELGHKHNFGCAFDLMEFLSHSTLMLDCINTIIEVLEAKNEIGMPNIIFKDKEVTNQSLLNEKLAKIGKTKPYKNEDDLYFEYIRSISAIHPNGTSYHPYFQRYDTESSPFLIWNHLIGLTDGDISLHIYDSNGENGVHNLKLQLAEIYNYVLDRYSRVSTLSKILNARIDNLVAELKTQKILAKESFSSYDEYLSYLKDETHKRNGYLEHYVEDITKIMHLDKMPEYITLKYSKYCNALMYSADNLRELLQAPLLEDSFVGEILMLELHSPTLLREDETAKTGYYYEKAGNLYDENECGYMVNWYRTQAKNLYKIVEKYAFVDEETLDSLDNIRLLAVLNTALYFYSLEHDTFINKNIPKTEEYRTS